MVYTEFVVEADDRFGEYNACNPNNETGKFECRTWNSRSHVPRQCAAGFDLFSEDCLNGTVAQRHIFEQATHESLEAQGKCCAACTAAGAKCQGKAASASAQPKTKPNQVGTSVPWSVQGAAATSSESAKSSQVT